MATCIPKVWAEFNGFGGGLTQITADILWNPTPVLEYGIRQPGRSNRIAEPGTFTFALNNTARNSAGLEGYYSLWHSNKRSGFDYNIPITITINRGGGDLMMWRGRLDTIDVMPGQMATATLCRAVDPLGPLLNTLVSGVSVQLAKRADELITTVLTASGDPDYGVTYSTNLETGTWTFPYALDDLQNERTTVWEALNRIVQSEQGHLYAYSDLISTYLLFHNEGHDATGTAIDLTAEPMLGVTLVASRETVIAGVQVTHPSFITDAATVVLCSLGPASTVLVASGESVTITLPYHDPNNPDIRIGGTDQIAPVATTDYTMNAAQDGSSTDLTANFTVSATATGNDTAFLVTNTGTAGGYLTLLQQRGKGIYRRPATVHAAVPGAWPFGLRTLAFTLPYQTDASVAQYYADQAAELYTERVPQVQAIQFAASSSDVLADMTAFQRLGVRILVSESRSGLANVNAVVRGTRLEWTPATIITTFYLETIDVAAWIEPAFSAGLYTASGAMTWTVASGDAPVNQNRYLLVGRTMTYSVGVGSSTVGGTPSTALKITLPAGKTAAGLHRGPIYLIDNGTRGSGLYEIVDGGTTIDCYLESLGNWAAATDATGVYFTAIFEVV